MAAIGKNVRLCETCGSTIDESCVDLGCMICLLDAGLDGETEQIENSDGLPSDEVGIYTIEHRLDGSFWELGHGATGVTYLAVDKLLDRSVALKIINSNLGSRSAEARERFMREARAAAALRHPNVATVYQFGIREATGQFFYAMELVEGETLQERVRRLGPLDVLATVDIALQVTAALEAAEQHGLVHRDLKPGNLMLVSPGDEKKGASTSRHSRDYNKERQVVATAESARRGGRRRVRRDTGRTDEANQKLTVKVIDFGVAKAVAEKTYAMAITHGGFVGTPAFASPEQFANAPVDVRSDIYSLGATLWFLLTGRLLFSGRTIEEIQEARQSKPLPIEQLKAARVPHGLISLLISMLAIEPAARPAGARELSRKLQAIRASITGRRKIVTSVALAAAIVALGTFVAVREFQLAKATPSIIPEKSVAVLPFENLSNDPNSAYFAEGIQEEILTRLASIAELKVISRNSTQRYHSKPGNLAEVAKQLGVANILEGSVQKAADQVRVNVQLINAQSDSHLWAETYDQKLTDVFSVESEIAKRIADSLQAKLTGREEQALATKPTNNSEAYDAYLRGLAFETRSDVASWEGYSPDLFEKAVGSYEQAVQLDPNFTMAWGRLARAYTLLYFNRSRARDDPAVRRDAAKRALETVQQLEPNSPQTAMALGYYQYRVLLDYGTAKITFDRVNKMLPGTSEVPHILGCINRREGHWNKSIEYFEQALARDPRNLEFLMNGAQTYGMLRQFAAALKLYDRVLDITPNNLDVMASKASIYQSHGKLREAATFLTEINAQTSSEETFYIKVLQLRLERNYHEAVQLLQARQAQFHYDNSFDTALDQAMLALMQRLAGDTDGAKVSAEQARDRFQQLCRDQPDNAAFVAYMSLAYAVLGQKEPAVQAGERAVLLQLPDNDVMAGPGYEENLAFIQATFGDKNAAISTLTKLLQTTYRSCFYTVVPVTPFVLKVDPIWDPLRSDPDFQKLCEEKQPSATP